MRVASLLSPGFHQGGQAGVTKGHNFMSSTASYDSSPLRSRTQSGPITPADVQSDQHGERRAWHRSRRRARNRAAGTWGCPACELPVTDLVAADVGFCPRCQDFTGLCGAGRRLVCPDIMTWTTWHTPCTSRGVTAWRITDRASPLVLLLCPGHDEQIRAGLAAWIRYAIPLDSPTGP